MSMRNSSLYRSVIALFIILTTAFAVAAHGEETWSINDIHVEQAWARIGSPSANLGSVYLTVHNNSGGTDYLIAATSPAAGSAAIYEVKSEKGTSKLFPIPGGLNLTDHREVVMRPDGIRLVLDQMKVPLESGNRLPLRLIFLNAGTLDLEVRVYSPNEESPPIIHRGHNQ